MASIGLFTYSVKPRGSVVHAACLAEALVAEGADVTLYALAKNGDGFFRELGCPLVLFPAAPAPDSVERLIEQRIGELKHGLALLQGRHGVLHAEDCLTANALLTGGGSGLAPIVRTVHHVERFESPFLRACQRRSIELADALVSVSAFTAREVAAEFSRDSRVIHNGVDFGRFDARTPEPDEAARAPATLASSGLGESDLLVLSVGGVEERKNTLRALEAVIQACEREPRLFWVVAGGASIWDHSELERRFDARVAGLPAGIRRRVVRTGPVDEATLGWLYRRSDVLFAPALHEGFGLSVLEAMAARTAVVCSDREPFTEFVDRETALLVDPRATTLLAAALGVLGRDAALRERLARAGEQRARAFSWRRAARAHLELYAALEQRTGSAPVLRALPAA